MKQIKTAGIGISVQKFEAGIIYKTVGGSKNTSKHAVAIFKVLLYAGDYIIGQWFNAYVPPRIHGTYLCILMSRYTL